MKRRAGPGVTLDAVLGELPSIQDYLLKIPGAAEHVIPHRADLAVLSLKSQVERVFGQLGNGQQ